MSKTVTNQFGDETTLYPFADYEITDEGKTKVSISGNNMHLATIERSLPDPLTPLAGGTPPSAQTRIIFSHTDHLGGGNILTDASGEQVQTLDYYPFGSIRVDEEYQNFDETKKFTGHEFDDESGLYYAQARYYDAEIGRFVSGDPLQWRPGELMGKFSASPQALNYYGYVSNNPLILIDPTGKELVISGASGQNFVDQTFSELQNLNQNIALESVGGSDNFRVISTQSTLGKWKEYLFGGLGEKLVTEQIQSEFTTTIGETNSGNSAQADNWLNATNGSGSNSSINFNPGSNPLIPTLNDNGETTLMNRPDYVGLAHELIHSEHMHAGTVDFTELNYQGIDNQNYGPTPSEELRTVGGLGENRLGDTTENDIRREHNLNQRSRY